MIEDELFDNGIDGEPFATSAMEERADYEYDWEFHSESSDVHISKDLEIKAWPGYGNYTIITDTFQMYLYPGSNILQVHDLRLPNEEFNGTHQCVMTLRNIDLYFFGEKNGPDQDDEWNIDFYTGEQVNQKIQRYLNLRAFL